MLTELSSIDCLAATITLAITALHKWRESLSHDRVCSHLKFFCKNTLTTGVSKKFFFPE